MATRNQVLSLFGASPEQILQQRRQEQAMEVLKQSDPYQRAGSAIGLGLARMFGGEPAEVTRQRELYGMLEGVNFESPEQMRQAATSLQSQFPDRALQLLSMADQLETTQQQRATSAATEAQAGRFNIPVIVDYKRIEKANPIPGQPPIVSYEPVTENVPHTLDAEGNPSPLIDLDKYYPNRKQAQRVVQQGTEDTEALTLSENAIVLPNTTSGIPIAKDGDVFYQLDSEGNPLRVITKEEAQRAGATIPEPKKPELPIIEEQRKKVEEEIKTGRIKQSTTSPSATVFDRDNPFAGGL